MFARVKKSGSYQYLQIVENRWEKGQSRQRVIATLGRLDQMTEKRQVESLVRSLSRFSEKTFLILSDKSKVSASAQKIGPALIFERLWKELGIGSIVSSLVAERKFGFSVERAMFLTVLHRLFVSGSDRGCEKWRRDYRIDGAGDIALHQLYRAMAFLGEEVFGIIAGGGALSALLLREFKVYYRVPPRQYVSAMIGGLGMGLASRMAPGCNDWHLLGGLPILAWQSLLFLAGMIPGAWLGSRLLVKLVLK